MSLAERSELISACKWVDEIADKDIPYNPTIALMDSLNCPYVAHGDDLALAADGTDSYSEIKKVNRMKIFKRTQGISTTDVVSRILALVDQDNQNQAGETKKSTEQEKVNLIS